MKLDYGLKSSDNTIRKGFHSHFFGLNKKVLPIVLVILMAIQMVIPFYVLAQVNNNEPNKQVFVEGESYVVNSWEELKQIIEDGTYNGSNPVSNPNNINIVINGSIGAKSTINITSGKTISISGQNNAIIYGALDGTETNYSIGNNIFDSMFKVNGGTLNIDNKVTLSGERAVYKDDTCNDNVPLNDNSVVGYDPRSKYDFSNYGEISYTKSVVEEAYDYTNSSITYVPYVYPNAYDFTNFTTTYTPGSKGNQYTQFSYPNAQNFEKFGIVSARKMASDDTTAVCVDSAGVEWKMYFSRSPQKPYATSQSVSGVGDWIRVGEGVDDSNQKYYYFYATEFNKRIYIAADGTLARDWGSIFDGDKDGKIEYRWYPKDGGLEAQISVLNPKTGNYELETHYMHRDAQTGALTFPTITSYNDSTGLYVNGDTQVRTPESSPITTGSWGRTYRVYSIVNVDGDLKNGSEVSELTVGGVYHIQGDNGDGWYTALAVNDAANGLVAQGSTNPDPNTGNNWYGKVVWKYMEDGTFRSEYPSWWNDDQKLTIYWDGNQIKSTSWSNWQTLKVPHNSSLKLKNIEVFKPTDSTTGLALSGSPIMVLDSESLEEKSSLSNGDVVVLQSDGLYFFDKESKWVEEPDDEATFKWTYNNGVLSNGDYKIFIESDGTNPRVVNDSDRGSNPTSNSQLKAGTSKLFKGSTTGTVLNTTGSDYLTLYESNTNSAPTTEASATLTDGAKYVIKSGNAYLRGKGTGYDPEWVSNVGNWPRFDWTYNSSDGTLSHGNYKILVNSDGSVEIVDSTKNKVDGQDPALKINDTTLYKGSLFSSESGDPVYLYKIAGTTGYYRPGDEASSINDGPFYVKAGNQWLKKESNEDARWAADPGTTRQYNDSRNPYVWEYDSTNKTLKHGDYVIYLDETNGIVVNKNDIVGDITFGGSVRYATTDSTTSLFTTSGTNSVYMYEVNTNGTKGNHADNGLTLDKYYYLVTEEDNKYLQANENGGSWTDFTNPTTQNNPFAWKYVEVTRGENKYKVLYNELTDQIIYHDGNKMTMAPNTVAHCDLLVGSRWTPIAKNNPNDPSNWHHVIGNLPGVSNSQKGYFITATNGATVNSGATYKNLWAGDGGAVKNYAPIVIDGSNFNMSEGSIENNKVGYTADESKSGLPVNSNDNNNTWYYVGAELGSATPNNIPKPTKTAGGIIFTNNAIASITGDASIHNNKGDVGGILVQGDSIVVLGGEKSGDTVSASDGGHIDRNIGFHYSGAALVEGGGTLVMAGTNSTMNYNVSWNKGGAVWVTEYGTSGDGFGVRKGYQKPLNLDQRWTDSQRNVNPGKFLMLDGKIQYNTAFHRGGAINVESDYVVLRQGEISYNNCRALGGGIYVEGDYADYNYTLQIDDGYIGHNYAISADPSMQDERISYHSLNEHIIGHGYLDEELLSQANDILDRKIRTGNDTSVTGTLLSTKLSETGFEPNVLNPLSEADISNDTSDQKVWQGYRRNTGWEGNGGGVWLCPIGSTGVFNMNDQHEVYIDDNYASGATPDDPRDGTDIYLWPGTGHIIAREMNDEIWKNENTGAIVPELSSDADSRIYTGPLALINITTAEDNPTHSNYDQKKVQSKLKIVDNLSRNGGGIAADGTVLFGEAKDLDRHEAELTLTKRWSINIIPEDLYFKMFYVDGSTEIEMVGYDFELRGSSSDASAYSIVQEYNSTVDPATGEKLWKARFSIPVTATLADGTVVPMYKFVNPNFPDDRTKDIDPSNEAGSTTIRELLQAGQTSLQVAPGSWKLEIREYDSEGNQLPSAFFKDIQSLTFSSKVNPIKVFGGQGQELTEKHGYDIKFSVAQFAQEVVNENPTVEKYINNIVHESFYSFDDTFEYEIMAYIPADATEAIIYDTLQAPLMFVDNNGNAQYILNNDTQVSNSQFINGNTANLLISTVTYTPEWVNDFTAEPMNQIEGLAEGQNYFIKTKTGNYYYKGNPGNNWVKSSKDWVVKGYNDNTKHTLTSNPVLYTYDSNNHKGDGSGTVSTKGTVFSTPVNTNNYVMIGNEPGTGNVTMPATNNIEGNTLYVKIDENTGIDNVRGKWVKVAFNAAIKPDYRNLNSLKAEGWVDNDYNKKGSPLPESKKSELATLTSTLETFVNTHDLSIAKVVRVGNRLYAKTTSTVIESPSTDEYNYYQLNLDGDKKWYRTFYRYGTSRVSIDNAINASDGQANAGKDSSDVALDGIYNIQGIFNAKDSNGGNRPNALVRTELNEGVLVSLETYLGTNDSIKSLKSYDRGNIKIYIAETEKGDYYQRVREVGNATVTDGVWYKTEVSGSSTKLTPLNGSPKPLGGQYEKDSNNNALEGYNAVKNPKTYSSATYSDLDMTEFTGVTKVDAGYNWPVIQATEPHSGEMNEAKFAVIRNNSQSIYKTNVVTFDVVQPEKYVNNKTHDILGAFDKNFEYEIMVYVPEDAQEIIIHDTLQDDLMFVDRFDNTQYKTYNVGTSSNPDGNDVLNEEFNKKNGFNESPMISNSMNYGGYRLTYFGPFDSNNHRGDDTGTVKGTGSQLNLPITKNQEDDDKTNDYIIIGDLVTDSQGNVISCTPNDSGKSIFIKINEETNIQLIRGKWLKVVFGAAIKPSRYDEIADKISKENLLTDKENLKDSNYPNPVGYYYRESETTLYSENKLPGTTAKPDVYYLKDSTGKFTDRKTGAYPTTRTDGSATVEGIDYRLEYEADFLYFSKTKPTGIANDNLKPMYVKKGWNNDDPTISWEYITDDGSVIDGEKLYNKTSDEDKPIGVQENGDHAGLANKAGYGVKFNNEYHYSTTNTVTVVPKERDLEITKIWQVKGDTVLPSIQDFIDNIELWWEYDDTNSGLHNKVTGEVTNLYKDHIRIVFDKTEVSGDSVRHEWKIIIDDLPKLSAEGNMHYFIKEKQPFTGYNLPEYSQEGHAHHNGRIKNGLIDNEGTTHLSVSKNWDDGISNENHPETITVRLLGNGETIYQRNSSNKIVDEDGNPITTSGKDPVEWEYSVRQLNSSNSFEYEWDDLPRYQFDKDGKQVYIKYDYTLDEYHKALNGEKFILNGNRWEQSSSGTVLTKEQIKQIFLTTNVQEAAEYGANGEALSPIYLADIAYSIELLSDPEGYVLTEVSKVNRKFYFERTNDWEEAVDYVNLSGGLPGGNSWFATVKRIIKYRVHGSVVESEEEVDMNSDIAQEIIANPSNIYTIDDGSGLVTHYGCNLLSSLPGGPKNDDVYVCEFDKLEEYDTYEVDLINTKPQIEKYINKDVHHETFVGNDFVYDIIAYVPEEATEIEIVDELLPTLKLKALLEPNITNDTIHGHTEYLVASLPTIMNVAVLSSDDHKVNGTVSNNKVDGSAIATIVTSNDSNSNSFKLKIENIYDISRSGGTDINGNPNDYIEYEHGEYYKVVPIKGGDEVYCKANEIPDNYRPINYTRYRIANQKYYSKENNSELTDDSIIAVHRTRLGSTEPSQFYKYMTNEEYETNYVPYSGIVDGYLYQRITKYLEVNSPNDQAIGGKYVRITFKAGFNLEKHDELKSWIGNPFSSSSHNEDLDWDVIKTESNHGWDTHISSLGYRKGIDEYVLASNVADGPVTELVYALGRDNINKVKVVKNGDKYYGALDNAGNYYVYPMNLTTDTQYNNQWFRVVGNPIRYYTLLDSENPVKNGSTFDGNSDYWFAGNNNYIKPTIDSGTNLITNDTTIVPVVENETYYKEVDGTDVKYYLDWVVNEYAGDKKDSIIANGAYKKIDWGRGDGDIIRTNLDNPSGYTGNHAGVVNTASYEVTYGNRYKSTHKSNTVTVVPEFYELPSSGGIGTFLFNILGAMFISLALFEITFNIKRKRREREGGIGV